ncbi:MAG: GyrI-like domain-containing protein [Planctomycetota bacterium]|jgi:effector-binding domain-containing protein
MKHIFLIGVALASALLSSCSSTGWMMAPVNTVKGWFGAEDSQAPKFVTAPDVTITAAPFETVHVQWKQALDTPYVYLSLQGDYRDAVRYVGSLMQHLESQGVRPTGPPFALYFDDPLEVPIQDRRFQVAVPVDGMASVTAPLGFSVLPSRNLIYSRVSGSYPDAEQAYPQMFQYLRDRSWVLDGPIRQILLVDPASVATFNELVSEVQMPFRPL